MFATTNSGQILTFPVNLAGGGLGAPTSIAGPANAAGLATVFAVLPTRLNLYVSDPQAGAIRVYTLSSTLGSTLSPASVGPYPLGTGNGTPGEMALGNALYVATSVGSIAAFNMNADGSLTSVPGSPFAAGTGPSHLAAVSSQTVANTSFLYASNAGDANGSISAFKMTSSGALVPVPGSPFSTVSGGGPAGFYTFGENLYVALQNANAVAAFAIADDGSLTPLPGSPFPAGRGTFSLNGASGFLLATNNLDGTISSYSIDPQSGVLTEVAGSPFPGAVTSGDTVYSNGRLFVPDASSNNIMGFQFDSTGAVSSLMGSPFQAGAGPVALTAGQFPGFDP
ncbi:MAG TPA: beta-propeller fold lactonase family protein [Candidatus Acidoferrum sp.]